MDNKKTIQIFTIILILILVNSIVPGEQYLENEDEEKKALILNPAEYMYGNRHCMKIVKILSRKGYNVTYLGNNQIDLNFTKNNLSADIVYINTHAGYWDTDGDQIPDTVVIATGEKWTSDTVDKYSFEYENKMIVKGQVGENYFVSFTPGLIGYYYHEGDMSGSLIYMATCDVTYDDSMANAFLNASASVYVGWDGMTVSWTNSLTSVFAFRLLGLGFKVKNVCRIIRYGGFYNRLFRSKLTYFGDGDHKIN